MLAIRPLARAVVDSHDDVALAGFVHNGATNDPDFTVANCRGAAHVHAGGLSDPCLRQANPKIMINKMRTIMVTTGRKHCDYRLFTPVDNFVCKVVFGY